MKRESGGMPEVLGVILNWRRPANVRRVLRAMREQSVPLFIALVECAPGTEHAAGPEAESLADIVFTVNKNTGPTARFIPPLALPGFKYTYFGVDDHLPGRRHLEWMLKTAADLNDNFATIGQDGRRVDGTEIIRRRARLHETEPKPVDFITSSELMLSRWVPSVIRFRDEILSAGRERGEQLSSFEDDLFLCFGTQVALKARWQIEAPCYLTPKPPSDEEWWAKERLPAPHALCGRPDHDSVRRKVIEAAIDEGWYSRVK